MAAVRSKPVVLEHDDATSIVALDRFIMSTRDSGYKSTGSAVAELIDNAIEAEATRVDITIAADGSGEGFRVAVVDNGEGMDRPTLVAALRFGGTSRYNNRSGLGRFGMGLPNASLSQARRLTVYTWQWHSRPMFTYLDVDEIVSRQMITIPAPRTTSFPEWIAPEPTSASGTIIVWDHCDRLDHKRSSTIERKLHDFLGRVFRHFLWSGVIISINGHEVEPIDPLFVHPETRNSGGCLFQEPIQVEVYADRDGSQVGQVEIRFSELPISEWHELSNEEKRRRGITNGAGVSVIRGGREVDFGWFFMGSKRRENYDDWWRCEVRFSPELDEAFGITHTKQQIKPKEHLLEAIQPIIESTAKALNARVRDTHTLMKSSKSTAPAEEIAAARDSSLKPLDNEAFSASDATVLEELTKRHAVLTPGSQEAGGEKLSYKILDDDLAETAFFRPVVARGNIISLVNPRHLFYKKLYQPLRDGTFTSNQDLSQALQLVLLAAARAEAEIIDKDERLHIENYRKAWSGILDVLLRG